MNCHGENNLQRINKRMCFLNGCRISGHFDTKFTTIAQIGQILQKYKDPKIGIILNLERVYFLVTRVKWLLLNQYFRFPLSAHHNAALPQWLAVQLQSAIKDGTPAFCTVHP